MKYNFDQIIDRQGTNCMNTDGFRDYMFKDFGDVDFPYEDHEFIRMWIADMDFRVSKEITDAISNRVEHGIFGYTKAFDKNYYRAFSNWTSKKYEWKPRFKHLRSSAGVIPALYNLVDYRCKADEKVLIVTPSYAFFKHAADHNNVELVTSDLIEKDNYYTMDFDDIEKKVSDEKLTLAIFCNPHNPTGRIWNEEELRRFADICLENGVMIISDEIHCDLLRVGNKHIPLAKLYPESDQIITCMAPSKTFNLAGLMFANIIIPNDEIRTIWDEKCFPMSNPLSLVAAHAAYEDGEEWLDQLSEYLDGNFDYLDKFIKEKLPRVRFEIPESTYLAWLDVNAYLPDVKSLPLFFAQNAGILLEGGNMFVANSDGYIRLNMACPRSVIEEGLKRIEKAINNI